MAHIDDHGMSHIYIKISTRSYLETHATEMAEAAATLIESGLQMDAGNYRAQAVVLEDDQYVVNDDGTVTITG